MRKWSAATRAPILHRPAPASLWSRSSGAAVGLKYRASYFERAERRKSAVLVNWIMPVFSHRVPVTFTATSTWRRNASDIYRRR